jgi:hypothetical protein
MEKEEKSELNIRLLPAKGTYKDVKELSKSKNAFMEVRRGMYFLFSCH